MEKCPYQNKLGCGMDYGLDKLSGKGVIEGLDFCATAKDLKNVIVSKGSEPPPFKIYFPLFKISPSLIISQPPYFATFCRRDISRHFVEANGCFFQTLNLQCLCMGIHLLAMTLKIVRYFGTTIST